jgi:capsid assembly protease
MPLIDMVQNKAWALHPAKLDEINAFIEARIADPSFSFDVARGKSGNKAEDRYEIRDGIAIIPVYGVIDKRANMFMEMSGGTSTELLKRDIRSALDDPKVDAILLDIDSPGGSVDGTKEVADFIFESRGQKPIIAYGNGMMASAAYWIGSAADVIFANDTAMVGSIGVALTHYDRSAQDEQRGIKRTTIYSGKYKRIASDEKPLSDEGKEYLQGMTDTYYSIFVEGISRNRDAPIDLVLEKMADGKDFIGKQAKKAGLIDHIGTIGKALKMAQQKGKAMDLKALTEKHPELYEEIYSIGKASVDVTKIEAENREAGTQAERKRVLEIMSAEADPKATKQAIQEGVSADSAYRVFFEAEKQNRKTKLEDSATSLPESVGHVATETGKTSGNFMALVEAHRKEKKCGLGTAMKAVAQLHPELHDAWLETQPKGRK